MNRGDLHAHFPNFYLFFSAFKCSHSALSLALNAAPAGLAIAEELVLAHILTRPMNPVAGVRIAIVEVDTSDAIA